MSGVMGPVASGIRPAMRRGAWRVRPDPAGRMVALARRWWMTEAMSSASANPRALMRRGRRVSTLWWLASARRSSAVKAPKASESITASAWSVVRPLVVTRVVQRSCWAAAAMVSYSAASWAIEPHRSCSAVMVSCADSSAPLCWSTP